MSGAKILAGLKQAVEGNFARVRIEGQNWVRHGGWKHVANTKACVLGKQQRNGFQVRRVVWGRLMAREDKRPGEIIKRAKLWVEA